MLTLVKIIQHILNLILLRNYFKLPQHQHTNMAIIDGNNTVFLIFFSIVSKDFFWFVEGTQLIVFSE